MLQATPHAIHFNPVLNLDEEQQEGGRYVIDFKVDQNFGEPQLKGEGITWMGQPSRQGSAIFSAVPRQNHDQLLNQHLAGRPVPLLKSEIQLLSEFWRRTRWLGSASFVTLGYWFWAVFLLLAATLPTKDGNGLGLIGSAFVTALLSYGIARFESKGQLRAYQPNPFGRVNQMVSKPILLMLLISSVASLVISGLIARRLRGQ